MVDSLVDAWLIYRLTRYILADWLRDCLIEPSVTLASAGSFHQTRGHEVDIVRPEGILSPLT